LFVDGGALSGKVAESTPGVEQRLDNLNNNPIREVLIRRQAGLLAIPGT